MNEHQRMMLEMRAGFAATGRNCHVIVTGIETHTPEQIMEELRQKDPAAHARLSEIVVIEDGQLTPESMVLLRRAIEEAAS